MLKEKSNLINMLIILVFFSLGQVITHSVCFQLLMIICVYDDELYSIYENLHYHLNDFVTLILYMAVTSILLHVLFIEKEFDSHTLRTSHLSFI